MKKELWNIGWSFCNERDKEKVEIVNLPHDAMQTEKRIPNLKNGSASGFYPGGKYIYKKSLFVTPEMNRGIMMLEFEGVYQKSTVYLNGEKIGGRIYGYSDFIVDLTGKVKENCENEIMVIADNTQHPNSRWYSGSGIYRDVYLHTAGQEYIQPSGVKVTTVQINPAKLEVTVDAKLQKGSSIHILVKKESQLVAEGQGSKASLTIQDAHLWDAEHPELYDVVVRIEKDGKIVDETVERTGIRMLAWDAKQGFRVNGKGVKLRGGCVHHDNGPIGACSLYEAELRKVRVMKEAGFNAVRYAHNPAGSAFLKACDELGIYVMNEAFDTWVNTKSDYDYALYFRKEWRGDLADMIRVSYNHPSVIMYSIGNEVYLKDKEKAAKITSDLVGLCRELDPSRPIINSINPFTVVLGGKEPEESKQHEIVDPYAVDKSSKAKGSLLINTLITLLPSLMRFFGNEKKFRKLSNVLDPLDVVGFNYGDYLYDSHHEDFPDRVICGSETFPSQIGKNWSSVMTKPWVIGDFLWTAWDYLGETGVGTVCYDEKAAFTQPYPTIGAGCCNIDFTGKILCQGYYTKIVYGQYDSPYIAVHPVTHAGQKLSLGQWRFTDAIHSWSWNGLDGKTVNVDVYSNAEYVELFQDGKSLGKKKVDNFLATYQVTYRAGELKAISYDANGESFEDTLKTAGEDTRISAYPEKETIKADGHDLIYIPIELSDAEGTRKMTVDREVQVQIEGAATLAGIATGDQKQTYDFSGNIMMSHHGRLIAVIRSNQQVGEIKVTISAEELAPKEIVLQAC